MTFFTWVLCLCFGFGFGCIHTLSWVRLVLAILFLTERREALSVLALSALHEWASSHGWDLESRAKCQLLSWGWRGRLSQKRKVSTSRSVRLTWSGRLDHSGPMNFFLSPQCQVLRRSRDSSLRRRCPSPGQTAVCVRVCVKDGVYVTEHSQRWNDPAKQP